MHLTEPEIFVLRSFVKHADFHTSSRLLPQKVSLKETQGGHRWIGQVGHSLNSSGSHVRGTWVCATTGKKLRRPWARYIHTRMFLLQFARFSRRNLRFVSPMIVSRRDLADQVKPPSFLLSVFVCLFVCLFRRHDLSCVLPCFWNSRRHHSSPIKKAASLLLLQIHFLALRRSWPNL